MKKHFHKKATFNAFVLISPISLTVDIFQMLKKAPRVALTKII